MPNNLDTPENRFQVKKAIQLKMHADLKTAIAVYSYIDDKSHIAFKKAEKLKIIKYRIEDKAQKLGYSKACQESIYDCKGQCCTWHFPENLCFIDFFLMVCDLSKTKLLELNAHLLNFQNNTYQCPILKKNGCFLDFDTRPLFCTNAYPCFIQDQYWQFLAVKKKEIQSIYFFLNKFLEPLINQAKKHLNQYK